MKAVVLMATPYPKSLHGKGEKWIAQHVARPDDSVKHSQPRSQRGAYGFLCGKDLAG